MENPHRGAVDARAAHASQHPNRSCVVGTSYLSNKPAW
ncbi:hypothetical protein J2785_005502 [Burkholderia ambifaria]|nr:hypothetical protein [Burkholderia ambifaria]